MAEHISLHPELREILRFRPFPIPDPVPPWIFEHLDRAQLGRLALIEMEMRNEILEASLKANAQAMEILKGMSK